MSGKRSRSKGSRYERKIAEVFGAWAGMDLIRTPRSGGMASTFPGDVMPKGRDEFRLMIECKHQEGWSVDSIFALWPNYDAVHKWWNQCVRSSTTYYDATGFNTVPLLVFRKNRYVDLVMFRWADFALDRIPSPAMLLPTGNVIITLDSFLEEFSYEDIRRRLST